MFHNDTGQELDIYGFSSRDEINQWFYKKAEQSTSPGFMSMGLGFRDFYDLNEMLGEANHTNELVIYWNSSELDSNLIADTFIFRL
jgi:hypothetical protein